MTGRYVVPMLAFLIALPLAVLAQAPQGRTGIVLPDSAVANEPVKVIIDFAAAQRWCGLRVDFGDGDVIHIQVDDFPLKIIRRYAAPGRYVIRAEGRLLLSGITSSPGCTGAPRSAVITVDESLRLDKPLRPRQRDDDEDGNNGNNVDKRAGRPSESGVGAGERRREDRWDGQDRDPGRNAQEQRQERGSQGASSRQADPPPGRAATLPAPLKKPLRDESLKAF